MTEHDEAVEVRRFEELALPHADALYRTAFHLTRSAADAEDLTQETYLRAYRAFGGFQGTNPKAWLFTILRHAYVDAYRRQRREPIMIDIEDAEIYGGQADFTAGPWAASAEAEALANLPGERVVAALETLPDAWRLTVLLADVEDFSYREIADVTGVPLGTVMSRLHRGRQRLYRHLEQDVRAADHAPERPR